MSKATLIEQIKGDLDYLKLVRTAEVFAELAADARRAGRIWRLIDGDVIFLLHALDQLFDKFVELTVHGHLLQTLAHFVIEGIAIHEGLLDGALEIVECLLAFRHLVPHIALEAALQKVVRERTEQILHAHLAGGVRDVFGVTNAFHNS